MNLQTATRQRQLLSFISPPCKGQFELSSIPLLSPSPPSDQILQAPDPGWKELKQLSESIRSALNPPEEGSTSQTRRQLHPKLGAAQRQASQGGQKLRQLAAEPGWMEPHDDKRHLCLYRVTSRTRPTQLSQEKQNRRVFQRKGSNQISWSHQDHTPPSHARAAATPAVDQSKLPSGEETGDVREGKLTLGAG